MTLQTDWPIDAGHRWVNFTRDEMTCRCGCGALPDPVFMTSLQMIRRDLGFGLPVTSGARCPEYNAKVSTTGRAGPHTTGMAANIRIWGPRAYALIAEVTNRGFLGIGVKQHGPHVGRFIHIDMLPESQKRPWVWGYA